MLIETGRVVAIESDAVWVETIRQNTCGNCAVRSGCGHGAMSAVFKSRKGRIRVRDGVSLAAAACQLDDTVDFGLAESVVLRAAALVYAFPLLLAVVSAVSLAPVGEFASACVFAVGLAAGLAISRQLARFSLGQRGLLAEPHLLGRVATGQPAILAIAD